MGGRGWVGKKPSGLVFGALVYSSVARLGAKYPCFGFIVLRQLPVNGTNLAMTSSLSQTCSPAKRTLPTDWHLM